MGKIRNDEVPMLASQSPLSYENTFSSIPVNSMESSRTGSDCADHRVSLEIDSKDPFTPACVPFQQFTDCNDPHCTFCKPYHGLKSAQQKNYVASRLFDHEVLKEYEKILKRRGKLWLLGRLKRGVNCHNSL